MAAKHAPAPAAPSRAAIYARYSSHNQRDESIEQQVAECEEYAARRGYSVVARFADHAISGRSDRRPEFLRMLRAADRREFDVLIAYKSNRISRNMLHALSYEEKLSRCGVQVVYCREEFGDNAAGRFALRTMMNVNQFYSENMAEDIMRGMEDNARQCRVNGSLPLGYKRGPDGRYAIDEETAPVVREIFRRIASGELKAPLAAELNARGILTSKGKRWNKGSFHSMLHNERYVGVYIYGERVRIPGGIPAIVDPDTFARVQEQEARIRTTVMSRRRREGMEYLLTGKLFCGYCLDPMVGSSGTGRSGAMHYYYRCRNNAERHTCRKKPVRKDDIERLVVASLRSCVLTDENVEKLTDLVMQHRDRLLEDSDLPALESRLSEVRAATRNLVKAIEAGILTDTTKARLEELEAEQKDLLSRILVERRAIPDVTRDHVRFYFERFARGDVDDPEYMRLLIRHFLHAVYLYDDHLRIVFSYSEPGAGVDVPIAWDDGPPNDGDDVDVLIEEGMVHHSFLIRTPASLRMIGRVFVLFVRFA